MSTQIDHPFLFDFDSTKKRSFDQFSNGKTLNFVDHLNFLNFGGEDVCPQQPHPKRAKTIETDSSQSHLDHFYSPNHHYQMLATVQNIDPTCGVSWMDTEKSGIESVNETVAMSAIVTPPRPTIHYRPHELFKLSSTQSSINNMDYDDSVLPLLPHIPLSTNSQCTTPTKQSHLFDSDLTEELMVLFAAPVRMNGLNGPMHEDVFEKELELKEHHKATPCLTRSNNEELIKALPDYEDECEDENDITDLMDCSSSFSSDIDKTIAITPRDIDNYLEPAVHSGVLYEDAFLPSYGNTLIQPLLNLSPPPKTNEQGVLTSLISEEHIDGDDDKEESIVSNALMLMHLFDTTETTTTTAEVDTAKTNDNFATVWVNANGISRVFIVSCDYLPQLENVLNNV